jgi:hypothetical protein
LNSLESIGFFLFKDGGKTRRQEVIILQGGSSVNAKIPVEMKPFAARGGYFISGKG